MINQLEYAAYEVTQPGYKGNQTFEQEQFVLRSKIMYDLML